MKIGEIVEVLIGLKGICPMLSEEETAITEACNLLDKLPRMEEATTYEPIKN